MSEKTNSNNALGFHEQLTLSTCMHTNALGSF